MPARLTLVSHALCPYVQRAAIALAEKGVDFERIDIDLAHKPDWFLAVSPLGKTPVLLVRRDDGTVPVFESAVICEYLDETLPPPLHPADPLRRARHRAWIEVASATLATIWQYYTAPDAATFERRRIELAKRFEQVEGALGEGPWFDGAFSLVDAAFAPALRYFDVFDTFAEADVFATTPRVRAWRRALMERPSVRAAVAPEYPRLLRDFVERQSGHLGALSLAQRDAAAARPLPPQATGGPR